MVDKDGWWKKVNGIRPMDNDDDNDFFSYYYFDIYIYNYFLNHSLEYLKWQNSA